MVDPNIKKKADDIRNKIYGKEVRESLASGLEAMSSDVVENEGRQSVVESRQDSVESQWQKVVDETTGKDVISAPEIIAARNGEANLKARIDKDHQEVTTQLAQKVFYTDNVETMKQLNVKIGDYVETKGYHEKMDGGHAQYSIVEASSGTDDGGFYITLSNGLMAQLVHTNKINVKQFGAKGDGVTDDTLSIQNIFDGLTNGGEVHFPPNNTFITEGIEVNYLKTTISGGGDSSTIKQKNGVIDKPIIHAFYRPDHVTQIGNIFLRVKDIKIEGDWETHSTTNHGIYFKEGTCMIENVRLYQINGDGISNTNGNGRFHNLNILQTAGHGIYLGADSSVTNFSIGSTQEAGIRTGGTHNNISGGTISMAGHDRRNENINTPYGHGMRLRSFNTVSSVTVIAGVSNGFHIENDSIGVNLQGVARNNGKGIKRGNGSAGVRGRGLKNCIINVTTGNAMEYFDSSAWGWQEIGVNIHNRVEIEGNIINATTINIDKPLNIDNNPLMNFDINSDNIVNVFDSGKNVTEEEV